jgi:hypothetical protein
MTPDCSGALWQVAVGAWTPRPLRYPSLRYWRLGGRFSRAAAWAVAKDRRYAAATVRKADRWSGNLNSGERGCKARWTNGLQSLDEIEPGFGRWGCLRRGGSLPAGARMGRRLDRKYVERRPYYLTRQIAANACRTIAHKRVRPLFAILQEAHWFAQYDLRMC